MRIKALNKIALLLVSIASLLMFLPTVLPHHHHGDAICFCSHPEKHDTHEHHCATHTDTEASCTLNINYFTPKGNDTKIVIVSTQEKDSHHLEHHTEPFSCAQCSTVFSALHLFHKKNVSFFIGKKYSFLYSEKSSGRAPQYFS
ncbi:MAG: hypothetical protein PHD21_01160 [Flavobacteriales bacterium]|nr:hypothetical protein [Flavobacteriales bacterium]